MVVCYIGESKLELSRILISIFLYICRPQHNVLPLCLLKYQKSCVQLIILNLSTEFTSSKANNLAIEAEHLSSMCAKHNALGVQPSIR